MGPGGPGWGPGPGGPGWGPGPGGPGFGPGGFFGGICNALCAWLLSQATRKASDRLSTMNHSTAQVSGQQKMERCQGPKTELSQEANTKRPQPINICKDVSQRITGKARTIL
ncbi:hypothetical protein ACH5RR_020077 [Cinchona calisaya]|uniref:Glycine-rich protein n=1 Tax=Cinchona calisaya TaxID=153742 RepID=A0ABD2ZIE6_9GENT